jgi:hypothetical protein
MPTDEEKKIIAHNRAGVRSFFMARDTERAGAVRRPGSPKARDSVADAISSLMTLRALAFLRSPTAPSGQS